MASSPRESSILFIMADLNEPKKETKRIALSPHATHRPTGSVEKETTQPPAGTKLPATSLRPQPPPSVASRLLPPTEVAPGPRPPAPPLARPPAPAPSGAARPPNSPPPPAGANAPVSPPRPLGPIPPSPSSVAPLPGALGRSQPGFPPISRPLENRGPVQAGLREVTPRIADTPMKGAVKLGIVQPASVPLAPVIRTPSPAVANSPAKGLTGSASAHLYWALLGISVLTLFMQLWNYFS